MIKVAVIGASGYTGAQLATLLLQDSNYQLSALFVSEQSNDRGKPLTELYPQLVGKTSLTLQPLNVDVLANLSDKVDVVCLAIDHELSATMAPLLLQQGLVVFDLSGGHRLASSALYQQHYQFEHPAPELLSDAVYGLAEWYSKDISVAQLIAVPGCYPTASLLALKPLQIDGLLEPNVRPVINAVSGVSGAGRKASLTSSFCQVSLAPYGVLNHRHQPEIEQYLGTEVVFTPHLGAFKRGILATVTAQLKNNVTNDDIEAAFQRYQHCQYVHLLDAGNWPKIDDVAYSNNCLLAWQYDEERQTVIVASAIDNLLKGAASQAYQCMNIRFGYEGAL